MAIKIQRAKKHRNIGKLISFLVIIIVILAAGYALFFAPKPAFDYIAPAELERTRRLSTFDINPQDVLDRREFKMLNQFSDPNVVGDFGRGNPFTEN